MRKIISALFARFKKEKYLVEIWRKELSGEYTNCVTGDVLSSEKFSPHMDVSLQNNIGFIITEKIV